MEATGKVIFVSPKTDIYNGTKETPIFKQDLGLDTTFEMNGTSYPGYLKVQAVREHTDKLSTLNVGDEVRVTYVVKGNLINKKQEHERTAKNPNHVDVMMNFNLTQISVLKSISVTQQTQQPQQPQQVAPPRPSNVPADWTYNFETKEWTDDLPF